MEISCTLGGQYLILPYAILFDMYPHATRKESIGYSAYFMALDVSVPERSILSGLCIRKDGRLYTARINLDDYYENAKGVFKSVTSAGRFSRSARDIKLSEISEAGGVPLQADLSYDGVWYPAEVDLSICIVNKGEGFMYDQQYVTFCEYSLLTLTYHFTAIAHLIGMVPSPNSSRGSLWSVSLSQRCTLSLATRFVSFDFTLTIARN